MKTVRELYPGLDKSEWFYGPSDYYAMIREYGNVIVSEDADAYQGDSAIILEKDGKYGYLCFGWGSCSGCDWLQGCNSYEEIDEVYKGLENMIQWHDSKEEMLHFIHTHDWKGDHLWYGELNMKAFMERAEAILTA